MSAPSGQCPRCKSPLTPGQDWCTTCGYAATTRILRPGNWRIPIIVVTVIFLLGLGGVAAAFVAVSGDTSQVKTITNPPKTLPATGTAPAPKPSTTSTPTTSTPTTSAPTSSSPTTSSPTTSTPTKSTPTTSTATTTTRTKSQPALPTTSTSSK